HGLTPGHPAQRPREGMVRIGFLMGRSFTEDRHQADIVTWLRQWGATAEPLHLGDDLIDVARVSLDHDLFVLKSRSDLAMSVAADLHGAGARVLNPYPVSALLRDRVVTFRVPRAEGAPLALSPELVDIARRCGAALGIVLFSVTVVESAGRAYVVDMSSCPAFRGVPDAARRVAKYVLKAAERAACGEPVVPAELQR